MSDRVITGAVINLSVTPRGGQNITIGRATALDVQEQYQVRPVVGIGNFVAQELPILSYSGGFTIQQFAIDSRAVENILSQFQRPGTVAVPDVATFVKQLMQTDGIDVTVVRKVKADDGTVSDQTLAKISGAICTQESMQIQEQNIVMRSGSFIFANPIAV